MSIPQVAIIGRANVGKSSLLNRLVRRRLSIVDPTPGVTRDRVSCVIELEPPAFARRSSEQGEPDVPRFVELIDTGGFGIYTADGERIDDAGADLSMLSPQIEAQILTAIRLAQLVFFVVDAQAGLTSLDKTIAQLVREQGAERKVLVVVNKVDDDSWRPHAHEFAGLGFGDPMMVSALLGQGVRELADTLHERLSEVESSQADAEPELKLAIVGRRNAGKSTLINTLAGEERVIVSEIAGTTRDSIDVRFEIEGRTMLAIDTAGVRRRTKLANDVEYYAYHRMLAAIRRADVAMLLLDAAQEISHVEKQLATELVRQFKPTVIVVNKWDLAQARGVKTDEYLDYLTEQLRGLDFAPMVFISATTGESVRDAVAMAANLYKQASHRETTGKVNAAVQRIQQERGPGSRNGKLAKIYYASQIDVNPPTIALVVNDRKAFVGQYERFLLNRLRDEMPFSEVPIRLVFGSRRRDDASSRDASTPVSTRRDST
jgi:GTP-binding protein